jgi:hypothetical protein
MPMSPVYRRYVMRIGVATGGYIAALFVAIRYVRDAHMTGPLAYLLGALPGLAVIAMFWAIGRLLVETADEYRRMLMIRQILVASGFALSVTTVWGFLENAGLVAHVDGFYVAILFFFGLAVGQLFNRITLGDGGGV